MRPGLLLILGVLGWAGWKVWSFFQKFRTPAEQSLAVRGMMAFALMGAIFLLGMVLIEPLPLPIRLLMIVPAFLVAGTVTKALRDAKARLRAQQSDRGNVEKMKRLN